MKTIKDELTLLTVKLRSNARVNLYDKNYLSRIKWTFPALLLITSVSLVTLFSLDLISQSQLIISSIVSCLFLLFVQWVVRRARIAVLKGDTIILKGVDAKSTVTSILSVRKVHTFHILGFQVTRLTYRLDHREKSSLVLGGPSDMCISLDKLIQHAKNYRKKIKGKS